MKTAQQYKEFSDRFRRAMRKAKLDKVTREQAAHKLGFSAPAISFWWNGKRIPRPTAADKLAKKLKCSTEWLLTGKEAEDITEPVLPANPIELLEQIMLAAQTLKAQQAHRERRKSNDGDRRVKK